MAPEPHTEVEVEVEAEVEVAEAEVGSLTANYFPLTADYSCQPRKQRWGGAWRERQTRR